MAIDEKPQLEINDQEETILSTHARAAQLEKAVQEARSQIADKSRRRRAWVAIAVVLVLVAAVAAGLVIAA
jgi:fatty acid desaturase